MLLSRLSLRDLEYAVAVAEARHFGRAAARCHVSQPALSAQVKKLEGVLGVQLFERAPGGVIVTEAGKPLILQARKTLDESRRLLEMASASGTLSGELRIDAIATLGQAWREAGMIPHHRMLADYNAWANRRLYNAVAALSDEDYRAERGAFFGSVHRTLNHLLVADRIWMRRFTGDGPTYSDLGAVLCEQFDELRRERDAEDARIVAWVGGLDDKRLTGAFTYRPVTNPTEITQPLAPALAHLFNHQTHHRGQAHCLLTVIGGRDAAPSLDLILFQRETGIGLS
jgi:uncharacterized damage-inducible protein DinB